VSSKLGATTDGALLLVEDWAMLLISSESCGGIF
jgi:hypothetical protein